VTSVISIVRFLTFWNTQKIFKEHYRDCRNIEDLYKENENDPGNLVSLIFFTFVLKHKIL